MTPYQKRLLNLEHLTWVAKVRDLEQRLNNCNAAIANINGRLRSADRALDLSYAQRQKAIVVTQLAEARAREQALARQLGPARGQFDDIREREVAGLATFAMLEKAVG